MELQNLTPASPLFRTTESVQAQIKNTCESHPDLAKFHSLGTSEEGRPIYGVALGNGAQHISLLAGAHSDEPVGPETLRTFILQALAYKKKLTQLFSQFKFIIIPHVNPDGEAHNQAWIKTWPDIESYVGHVFRELPGRDIEFGYPDMRQENRVVSNFLRQFSPYHMHMSLHGMGFSDGLFLLIEKHWIDRTESLQSAFRKIASELDFNLHDHDRKGEKGFQYIGPGFTTTPEGTAMRDYFNAQNDPDTAALFHDSSMEFVRSLGGDPLCLVTELPLFMIGRRPEKPQPGVPTIYLELRDALSLLRLKASHGESIEADLPRYNLLPLPLKLQIEIHLRIIEQGLRCLTSQ